MLDGGGGHASGQGGSRMCAEVYGDPLAPSYTYDDPACRRPGAASAHLFPEYLFPEFW